KHGQASQSLVRRWGCMARVFISHSSRDGEPAARIKAWLQEQGFETPFLDFDKHAGIAPGADWEKTLYREIEQSEAIIIVQTPNWLDSKWCFAEYTQARALGKAIFPVIEAPTGDTLIAPDIQALDLLKDREGGLEQLAKELTRIALDAQGGFAWDASRPPYPGLHAFQEEDAALYFGRDDDIRRLIERLNARRAQGGTKIVALANLALGLFVIAHCKPLSWRRLAPAGGMAGIAIALAVILPKHLPLHGEEIQNVKADRLFMEEGDVGTVQVLSDPDRPARQVMTVDGYKIGWSKAFEGSPFYRKQVILAHLPMILDTRIRHTLNVGLGSAATLQALATYPEIETLDCVEINQSVVSGAKFFDASAVLEDPRVHLVVDDAIHFLLRTDHQYDAIISDGKQHPFFAGNAALLCKEFYEYALEDLSPEGLFIQWMPLGTLALDQRVNLNTLCQVFPYVNVFFFPRESVLTIASRKPLAGRPGMTDDLFVSSGAKTALTPYQLDSVAAIRARWVAGKSQLAPLVVDAPVSTWNHLLLDFTAYVADRELWGRSQADNLKLLLTAERAPPVGVSFDPGDPAFVQSTKLIRRACAAFVVGDMALAKSFADQAVAANPNDIEARVVAGGIPRTR
ncbi:MAG: TIR domain-containing protein, partial [Proteobacteria bacterium]|nr:TIR domain-containing protein [Pseudomonadota bacterium]